MPGRVARPTWPSPIRILRAPPTFCGASSSSTPGEALQRNLENHRSETVAAAVVEVPAVRRKHGSVGIDRVDRDHVRADGDIGSDGLAGFTGKAPRVVLIGVAIVCGQLHLGHV